MSERDPLGHTRRVAPYLTGVYAVPERLAERRGYPCTLPWVATLDLALHASVTFFVGENGSGKSTLLEAMVELSGLSVAGGGGNERGVLRGPETQSVLAPLLRPRFQKKPRDAYFFRAELQAAFADLLDERENDPDFVGDPYARYGGRPLHTRSHGEAFLDVITNRLGDGLYFLDEPEAALSPQRQLALLVAMRDRVAEGAQFVIATHAPILLTYPRAHIVSFDEATLPTVSLEDTSHYQITRGILESPTRYWKHLGHRNDE